MPWQKPILSMQFVPRELKERASSQVKENIRALQKEYGLKRRLAPKLEDAHINFIDRVLMKYRVLAGMTICLASFFLLLLYK